MSKWDEQILVVNRKDLFNNEENHFYGFLPREDEKVKKIVDTFTSYEVKRRGDMEEDKNYKQLIGYAVIKDRETKEILVYKRLVGGGEARLAARELFEEVGISEEYALENLHFIGLINDDKTEVGQVHIGVVYECEVDKSNVVVREDDTLEIKWTTGDDARKEENYESWSDFLKPIM